MRKSLISAIAVAFTFLAPAITASAQSVVVSTPQVYFSMQMAPTCSTPGYVCQWGSYQGAYMPVQPAYAYPQTYEYYQPPSVVFTQNYYVRQRVRATYMPPAAWTNPGTLGPYGGHHSHHRRW